MFFYPPLKKSVFITLLIVIFAGPAFAANRKKLNGKLIKEIRSEFKMTRQRRAMYNAVSGNDIKGLALNRDLLRDHNEFYSHKIDTSHITNQKASGRCWMFAALNSLRPHVIKKNNLKDFKFSHIYLAFWDKMEKANTFYENIIRLRQKDLMDRELEFILRKPIGDGGYWENTKNLIEKYGVVPVEVMPETRSSSNTGIMNKVLERKLRVDAAKLRKMAESGKPVKELRKAKEKMLSDVYRILVMNMGLPPEKFDWRYEPKSKVDGDDDKDKDKSCEDKKKDKSIVIKGYTPKRFYKEFVGIDLNQYVDLASAAPHKTGRRYSVSHTKNLCDGDDLTFINVDIETLKSIAVISLKDSCPLWFSADVGIDQSLDKGIMANKLYDYEALFGVDLKMSRKELALYRQAAPTHAMNLLGVDIQEGKPVKWLVENSWGKNKGNNGLWTMYDDWFDSNVFSVIVRKKYVPKEVLDVLKQDIVVLPAWDPMW